MSRASHERQVLHQHVATQTLAKKSFLSMSNTRTSKKELKHPDMHAVPDQKPFTPTGLPSDVLLSKCRHEMCSGRNAVRSDPSAVLFALHTIDIRETYPSPAQLGQGHGTVASSVNLLSIACDEYELAVAERTARERYARHMHEVQERRDAGMGGARFPHPMLSVAYMTGVLPNGQKVGLVAAFTPSCEVELPDRFSAARTPSERATAVHAAAFWFRGFLRELGDYAKVDAAFIKVEVHYACRFKGYIPTPGDPTRRKEFAYARLSFPNVTVMRRCADKLRYGVREWAKGKDGGVSTAPRVYTFRVYEEGITPDDKFVDAYQLTPSGWHVATKTKRRFGAAREMLVDEEYAVDPACIRPLGGTDPCTGISPNDGYCVSIASLDCEMNSEKADMFPQSSLHKVVVVGVVFAFAGALPRTTDGHDHLLKTYVEYERHAFVLSKTPCAAIDGVIVHMFEDETEMLAAVRDELFVRKKIDVLLGHNIVTFDVKYMAERIPSECESGRRFLRFGALLLDSLQLHMKPLVSQGAGSNKLWLLNGAGFVYVDTYLLSKTSNTKLSENSLSFVSKHFLFDEEPYADADGTARVRRVPVSKFDMPYNLIPVAAAGGPEDWRKLVAYCVQDCILPLRLIEKWDTITDLIAQSRVITIPMATNVKVGQQQRVRNTMMRKAHRCGMVLNGVNEFVPRPKGGPSGPAVSAEGGFVLESRVGFHDLPIVVLDFASLYPSVQRAENLCWSTIIEDAGMAIPAGLVVKTYETKTGTFRFVQNVPGVFPQQLTDLLAVRQRAKDDMKDAEKGSAKWAQANSKQLATKIVMNSGYGTANAQKGIMPCLGVGTVTCFVGRELNKIAEKFCRERYNAVTYYGDTDSIMVYFPDVDDVTATRLSRAKSAWRMGNVAQDELNAFFAGMYTTFPPKTECENLYFPILLAGAKTYAGLKIDDGDLAKATEHLECPDLERGTGSGAVVMKGLRPVRRDVAAFLPRMGKQLLHALLYDRPEAVPGYVRPVVTANTDGKARGNSAFWAIVRDYVMKVCLQELPLADYVITQELKQGYDKQAVVRPHVAVSFAREWAVPGSGFDEGERIPYVMVAQADLQRTKRPPTLEARLRAAEASRCVGAGVGPASARKPFGADDGAGDDEDGGGEPAAGKTWHADAESAGAHARHIDEVVANPDRNTIDVEYYIDKGICSVLKQLFPDLTSVQAEFKRFAKSAMSLWRRHAEERLAATMPAGKTLLDRFLIRPDNNGCTDTVKPGCSREYIQDAIRAIRPQLFVGIPKPYMVYDLVTKTACDGSGEKAVVKKRKMRVFDKPAAGPGVAGNITIKAGGAGGAGGAAKKPRPGLPLQSVALSRV